MDAGLAAVLAGLVGAAGAALGAGLGARATFVASRQNSWDAQAQRQRDARRSAYADFAIAAGKIDSLLAAAWAYRAAPEFDYVPASLPAALAELDRASTIVALEGPGDLGELAKALTQKTSVVAIAIQEYKDEADFKRAYKEITVMIAQFINAAREHLDLTVEPPSQSRPLRRLMRRRRLPEHPPAAIEPDPAQD